MAIQRSLSDGRVGLPVRSRMGLHTGNANSELGDFFARTVVVVARVSATLSGGQILLSPAVQKEQRGASSLEGLRTLPLKGLRAIGGRTPFPKPLTPIVHE